ncbi:hypothetical protein A2165_04205 [Candidatus Curtissbacteria bacterium RBG_13_40_7]|uniref:Carrier domain-containing protein n=1 Tax=Candidatus Curtissbacteria bacterium RBG_13_40_7 TaxID=1797706 RepID=A0A1F5FUB6_9BACT|nr:MAG: hypothetical protein A2165_04205 [Candidatus Curtissbacteria bacterium RBG_13_40_7]
MADYFEEIKNIISNQFGIPQENIEEDSLLDEDLSITDLDLEDFLNQLQKKYDLQIPPEKISSFKKVSDIITYLYDNVQGTI